MMLSRMAEALYWMSRNLERADNTARLLEINLLHLIGTEETPGGAEQWEPLLSISGSEALFSSLPQNREPSKSSVVPFMTQEKANPNSIFNSIRLARENARIVRDLISKEMWEALNQSWLFVDTALKSPISPERAPAFYASVRGAAARFHGLTAGTMMAGEAYGFYRLGTFIERMDMTARILDVKYHILLPRVDMVGSPLDFYQWRALLKSLSAFEAFRRLHHTGVRPIDVTSFVVFNREFPRGLLFCAERLQSAIEQILYEKNSEASLAMASLVSLLSGNSPQSAFDAGLHQFLQEGLRHIAALHAAVQSDYFESNLGDKNALLRRA